MNCAFSSPKVNYYLGLDIGTDSVGYAVTDEEYAIRKFRGNAMWGTHVFDAANQAADRRGYRTARRRLERRKQRVTLLRELFAKEIAGIDPDFFARMRESALVKEERCHEKGVFADETFDDRKYNREYPTVHHLILDLIRDPSAHDVRLVYIACAWLVAHRGHFLSEVSKDNIGDVVNFGKVYEEFMAFFPEEKPWGEADPASVCAILGNERTKTAREKALKALFYGNGKIPESEEEGFPYSRKEIVSLLAGGKSTVKKLFVGYEAETDESISVTMDEENFARILGELGDDGELLVRIKAIADCAALKKLLGSESYISACKVAVYEQHKKDLRELKNFVKKYLPAKYREVFAKSYENNYLAYSENARSLPQGIKPPKNATQEAFCKYIKKLIANVEVEDADRERFAKMQERLEDGTFMPKQVTVENRLIPYQLYYVELKKILENAAGYLPFLSEKDADGLNVCDKILSVMEFRIPYYVGPLNPRGENGWMIRKAEGKIYPWNFADRVDLDASEHEFIRRMTNKCTYLPGEDVLPRASLLYQRFEVLNEINLLRVNGEPISVETKQQIYTELFVNSRKKVTQKRIREALVSLGAADKDAVISGVDEKINASLSSYHAFRRLLDSGALIEADVEKIILRSTVTEDRFRFRKWLTETYPTLSGGDVSYITSIRCKDFGRLSEAFLNGGVFDTDHTTGEVHGILDRMWNTNANLMQLLAGGTAFKEQVEAAQKAFYTENPMTLEKRMDAMYVPVAVRRPIVRTLDIVKDVVKALGAPPKRIFIEMARGDAKAEKGKRTVSRYEQLCGIYKNAEADTRELQAQLDSMGEMANNRLQSEKLFLYYLQLGKCAYTGKVISIEDLADDSKTNVDHIYPRARVKDDSVLNNKVLCFSEENGRKGDKYPVDPAVQGKMHGFWQMLKASGLMTEEKYKRLTRVTAFTEEEKWGFINRQLVETRQATKVLATLLAEKYPESEIVYVKAGIVSDFRKEYKFFKSRVVNDLHHAKDAYLNVVVGNAYNAKFTREWFMRNADTYSMKLSATFGKRDAKTGEWTGTKYFPQTAVDCVQATMAKNNIRYTAYAFCAHGGFFDQTIYPPAPDLVPLKKDKPTERYGGYKKTSVSFYTLAAFTQGKKKEVMFVPVEIRFAEKFATLPSAVEYAKEMVESITGKPVTDLSLPFGLRKIKIKTMLELDGFRVCLNGKGSGGERILVSPMNALILSAKEEVYVKKLENFREKRKTNPALRYSEKFDGFNKAGNEALYQTLLSKIETFYGKQPAIQAKKIRGSFEIFKTLEAPEQATCLLNLLTFFGRRAEKCERIDLGSGACYLSANLSNWEKNYASAYLIDISASGLYEKRSENLLELLR